MITSSLLNISYLQFKSIRIRNENKLKDFTHCMFYFLNLFKILKNYFLFWNIEKAYYEKMVSWDKFHLMARIHFMRREQNSSSWENDSMGRNIYFMSKNCILSLCRIVDKMINQKYKLLLVICNTSFSETTLQENLQM